MTLLLDTHFLIWIVLGSKRLAAFPWIERYRPWGISPMSLLEIQFLAEIGRLSVHNPQFVNELMGDPRFTVDDAPLVTLVRHALSRPSARRPQHGPACPALHRGPTDAGSPSAPSVGAPRATEVDVGAARPRATGGLQKGRLQQNSVDPMLVLISLPPEASLGS